MPASSHTLGFKCSEKQTVSRTGMKKPFLKHNAAEVLKTKSEYEESWRETGKSKSELEV